jgi:universal stress protein E
VQKVRNILVIVDPTADSHPAIDKVEVLAKHFGSRVELYIFDTKAAREMRLMKEQAADPSRLLTVNLKPMLESLAKPLRDRGLDVCTELEFGDSLTDGLLSRVRRTSAELVVKDTHPHSLLHRTLITNTDWHMIRECPMPLLLTKPKAWTRGAGIVAAVDPGHVNDKPAHLDHQILEWGGALARGLERALHAVHVYVPLTVAAAAGGALEPMASTLTPEAMEFEDKQKRKELQELIAPFKISPENAHLELGVATDILPRKAQELNADVMVMGAIARHGLARMLIGSTAERVLEKLPCDVLVVKPASFRDALPGM